MNKKFSGKFSAKGYYIALILCAAAIGISGYLYYRNITQENPQLQEPTIDMDALNPSQDANIPVVGPNDGGNHNQIIPDSPSVLEVCLPVNGQTVMEYAMQCLSYNPTTRDWRTHDGIDLAAEAGTSVKAAAAGTVYSVFQDDTHGTTVVIRHDNGFVTEYASLNTDVMVSAGDTVTMGQTIGYVGNTALLENALGDHLHFAVSQNGKSIDPMDFLDLNE